MAAFLVAFPAFTPERYWRLTRREYNALTKAYTKAHK